MKDRHQRELRQEAAKPTPPGDDLERLVHVAERKTGKRKN